jgi:hypothetical protein
MMYLKDKFNDELDQGNLTNFDDGIVKISGWALEPRQILEIASISQDPPTVYDQAFDAWKQDYVASKIEEANSLLVEGDQLARFAALQEKINKDSIIPFIGAGLSSDSGYPLWRDFLISLRKTTSIDEEDFISHLNSGLYEEAAEWLSKEMPKPLFSEKISSCYGISKIPMGVINLLPELFSGHVITTNFDHLVRDVYKTAEKSFAHQCFGYEAQNIRNQISDGSILLKLHGHADLGASRVFTKTEYELHYEKEEKFNTLIKFFADRYSFLFLGCSLSIDRPIKALKQLIDIQGYEAMPRHYAFLSRPSSDEERRRREHELSLHHIYPIWYPAGTHEESISALLMKLREDRS